MHDEFGDHLVPARFNKLIRLAEHGIERFLHGSLHVIRLHHAVHGQVSEPLRLVLFLNRLIQKVQILTGGGLHLEPAHWLVEVDGEGDLRQVLTYRVLDHGPDAELDLRVLEEGEAFSFFRVEDIFILSLLLFFN